MPSNSLQEKLAFALKKFVLEHFGQQDWISVGLETGAIESIQDDDRLFKALSWNDPDYSQHAVARTDDIIAAVRNRLGIRKGAAADDVLREYQEYARAIPRFAEWAEMSQPDLVSDLYKVSGPKRKGESAAFPIRVSDVQTISPQVADRAVFPETPVANSAILPNIFLVHGHDTARRDELELFVTEITGIKPTVLSKQANGGKTIIEKFEEHANAASVAIVLLTPDDFGGVNGAISQPRARQNVIFEMGYLTGRLSRRNVIPLNGGVEQPSDVDGLLYIPLAADWKEQLRAELREAGVQVIA